MTQAQVLALAVKKAGSQQALAELVGQKPAAISNWKAGRPIPDEVLAFLAAYVDQDPVKILAAEKGGLWSRIARPITTAAIVGLATTLIGLLTPDQVVAAEHCLHTAGVAGSNPAPPTRILNQVAVFGDSTY